MGFYALAKVFAVGGIQFFVAKGAQFVGVGIDVGQIAQVLFALARRRDGDVGEQGAGVGSFLAVAQRGEVALPVVVVPGGGRGVLAEIAVFA